MERMDHDDLVDKDEEELRSMLMDLRESYDTLVLEKEGKEADIRILKGKLSSKDTRVRKARAECAGELDRLRAELEQAKSALSGRTVSCGKCEEYAREIEKAKADLEAAKKNIRVNDMLGYKKRLEQAQADLAKVTKERDEARDTVGVMDVELAEARYFLAHEEALRLDAERDLAAWQEAAAKKDEAIRRAESLLAARADCGNETAFALEVLKALRSALSLHPSPNRFAEMEEKKEDSK